MKGPPQLETRAALFGRPPSTHRVPASRDPSRAGSAPILSLSRCPGKEKKVLTPTFLQLCRSLPCQPILGHILKSEGFYFELTQTCFVRGCPLACLWARRQALLG